MKRLPKIDCEHCNSRNESVFKDLCHEDLATLSFKKTCNIYKKGQVIFYEGNRPAGLYCLNQGKVKIFKLGKIGKEQIVRLAKPGDVLGYRALLGEEVYSASAEALEDSTICFLDKKNFYEVLKHDQNMPVRMMQLLCHELGEAENFIQSLAQKPVRERLAEVILILKRKYGTDAADVNVLSVSLTREDLANLVGTATETVIRLLSDFKDQQLISFEGRRLKIMNSEKLLQLSGADY